MEVLDSELQALSSGLEGMGFMLSVLGSGF